MLEVANKMDQVGYWSVEMWGGATYDSCLRYLNEDPWRRLRELKKIFKKTKLQMLIRGKNLVGYKPYSDEIVKAFVEKASSNGIDVFRTFDALNDFSNIELDTNVLKLFCMGPCSDEFSKLPFFQSQKHPRCFRFYYERGT